MKKILPFIIWIAGCQTGSTMKTLPAERSQLETPQGFELVFRRGQSSHRCLGHIEDDRHVKLTTYLDEKLVKEGELDKTKYQSLFQDVGAIMQSIQSGNKLDAKPCRIPFRIRVTHTKGEESAEGCLANEDSNLISNLIREIEFALFSQGQS